MCLIHIKKRYTNSQLFVYGILIIQILFLFTFSWPNFQSGGIGNLLDNQYSFEEFYSEDLFTTIRDDIGLDQSSYRVASLGFHPAISQYNGFYTIDGYFHNYPLEYKNKFREIIAPELQKSAMWQTFFDNWGNKAYIFSHEIVTDDYDKLDKNLVLSDFEMNTTAFINLGGRYLFSAGEINPIPDNFIYLNTYSSEKSPWTVWLYEIVSSD